MPVSEVKNLADTEPVVGRIINGKARAYPLRILTWHEIVNDGLGSVPVTVTYCPLCNSAIIFDRRLDGKVLDFGTTGKLRHSDMVMYDRQTENWWQQFSGPRHRRRDDRQAAEDHPGAARILRQL